MNVRILSLMLCIALSSVAFSDTEKIKELQAEIQKLNEQISELQQTVKLHEAKIIRLHNLLIKAGIDITEAQERKEALPVGNPNTVLTKRIFGVYLGENIVDVRKRIKLPEGMKTSENDPVEFFSITPVSTKTEYCHIATLYNQVYCITVDFTNNTVENFKIIKEQLRERYQVFSEEPNTPVNTWLMTTYVDDVLIRIKLTFIEDHMGDASLELTYVHGPLWKKLKRVRKAVEFSEDL